MTQYQDPSPTAGQVNQFGTPVNQYGSPVNQFGTVVGGGAPSVVPVAAPAPTRTDPVAIWALVLSILLWPVGLVLGITALVRRRSRHLGGKGLAIAAVVICGVHILLLPVVAAIAIPVFLNQKNKAVEADLAADLGTAATLMHADRALQGAFPAALSGPVATTGATEQVYLVSSSADTFCLAATGAERVVYMDEQSLTSTRGCP